MHVDLLPEKQVAKERDLSRTRLYLLPAVVKAPRRLCSLRAVNISLL